MSIDKSKIIECCICKKDIEPQFLGNDGDGKPVYWYGGNNAQPIHDGWCCNPCNQIVLAERMASVRISQWERNQ